MFYEYKNMYRIFLAVYHTQFKHCGLMVEFEGECTYYDFDPSIVASNKIVESNVPCDKLNYTVFITQTLHSPREIFTSEIGDYNIWTNNCRHYVAKKIRQLMKNASQRKRSKEIVARQLIWLTLTMDHEEIHPLLRMFIIMISPEQKKQLMISYMKDLYGNSNIFKKLQTKIINVQDLSQEDLIEDLFSK